MPTVAVRRILKKILNDLACESLPDQINELSLVFTDDQNIRILNAAYRGKDKATDVLSFSNIENCELTPFDTNLGELVISLETTVKQARRYKHSSAAELLRLLIHGLLHLHGYDHEKVPASEAQKMRRLEKALFKTYLPYAKEFGRF